jgi:DeoR-like helix-turn-helix domain
VVFFDGHAPRRTSSWPSASRYEEPGRSRSAGPLALPFASGQFVQRIASVGGSVRLSQIIEGVFTSPFVRVAELAERLGVTYPTAKSDLERLVQAGVLQELPQVTPKTFYAPEVFAVSYGELGQSDTP